MVRCSFVKGRYSSCSMIVVSVLVMLMEVNSGMDSSIVSMSFVIGFILFSYIGCVVLVVVMRLFLV